MFSSERLDEVEKESRRGCDLNRMQAEIALGGLEKASKASLPLANFIVE